MTKSRIEFILNSCVTGQKNVLFMRISVGDEESFSFQTINDE